MAICKRLLAQGLCIRQTLTPLQVRTLLACRILLAPINPPILRLQPTGVK